MRNVSRELPFDLVLRGKQQLVEVEVEVQCGRVRHEVDRTRWRERAALRVLPDVRDAELERDLRRDVLLGTEHRDVVAKRERERVEVVARARQVGRRHDEAAFGIERQNERRRFGRFEDRDGLVVVTSRRPIGAESDVGARDVQAAVRGTLRGPRVVIVGVARSVENKETVERLEIRRRIRDAEAADAPAKPVDRTGRAAHALTRRLCELEADALVELVVETVVHDDVVVRTGRDDAAAGTRQRNGGQRVVKHVAVDAVERERQALEERQRRRAVEGDRAADEAGLAAGKDARVRGAGPRCFRRDVDDGKVRIREGGPGARYDPECSNEDHS